MNPYVKMFLHAMTAAGIAGIGVRLGGGSVEAAVLTALLAACKDMGAFLDKTSGEKEVSL